MSAIGVVISLIGVVDVGGISFIFRCGRIDQNTPICYTVTIINRYIIFYVEKGINMKAKKNSSLSENNLVQKSRPLLLMKAVHFNLGELKILDTYLSRINSHDEDSRAVSFTKHEYEVLMGLTETRIDTLKKYTRSMLTKVAEVPLDEKNFSQITLFYKADFIKDDNGEWRITLICSDAAKQIFFNIEDIGYIRYRLKNVINLNSKYSVLLYLYLLDNEFRKTWTVSLIHLRENIMFCSNEYNKQFKYFNREVLKKCINEINNLTDINVSYLTQKTGRTVTAIQFTCSRKNLITDGINGVVSENKILHFEIDENKEIEENFEHEYSSEYLEFLASACDNEFNNTEMKIINDILVQKIDGPSFEENQILRYDLLSHKYHELELQASKRTINNRFAYLRKLLETD